MNTGQNTYSFFKFTPVALGAAVLLNIAGGFTAISDAEARAKVIVKSKATGIGYAHSKYRAKKRAVQAWIRGVRKSYGNSYSNFYRARNRNISCDYIGYNKYSSRSLRDYRRGKVIETIGSVNSPWTCSAIGNPVRIVAGPVYPDHKRSATGIGYGHSKAGARGLAVRAWTKAVRRAYGPAYAKYSYASKKHISCDYIGRGYKSKSRSLHNYRRGQIIGEAGNVNSPWTCSAVGRPRHPRY